MCISLTSQTIGVAVLGRGTVGSEVVRLLLSDATELATRAGAPIVLRGVAVRHPERHRDLPDDLVTDDAAALIVRDDVDIVVEVIGGIDPPRELLLTAIKAGKSVVTANKALLADHADQLTAEARRHGIGLFFEAAVAGAVPVVRPLMQSLAGDRVSRIVGIVNGTTNFILSAMAETGAGYAEMLARATAAGYAEADPTADVEGYDAAAKAAILASLAFHTPVTAADVYREGISGITAADFAAATALNCTVKLLAVCERFTDESGWERISARVYPALVPLAHPLAAVSGAYNAVVVEAESAGRLMFYGQGAGGAPTASAVLGDLMTAARSHRHGGGPEYRSGRAALSIAPILDTTTRYHIDLRVVDRAGVLAGVAAEFAKREVSIAAVRQEKDGAGVHLTVTTHAALESALAATVEAVSGLASVVEIRGVLRMEGTGE
ncbi:homoserine dehydrogenase [Nocardia sp. NPDC006630]|uniref:homoserine dehydrogenase n=1 Tax=Nocardia sp. NPDC006630 TaxID=3157181 RepID=UPI0033AE3719